MAHTATANPARMPGQARKQARQSQARTRIAEVRTTEAAKRGHSSRSHRAYVSPPLRATNLTVWVEEVPRPAISGRIALIWLRRRRWHRWERSMVVARERVWKKVLEPVRPPERGSRRATGCGRRARRRCRRK